MSEIKVDKISPSGGANVVTLGDSGDTFTIPVGATLANAGTATGFGGGAWNIIGTAVASNSASLIFTGIVSTYDSYVLTWADVVLQTDGQMLGVRFGDAGGIDSGGSDYSINRSVIYVNGSVSDYGTTSRNFIDVSKDEGNTTGEGCSGRAYLHSLTNGSIYPSLDFQTYSSPSNATYKPGSYTGSGMLNASMTVTQVQLIAAAGNLVSGRATLYGIAHA